MIENNESNRVLVTSAKRREFNQGGWGRLLRRGAFSLDTQGTVGQNCRGRRDPGTCGAGSSCVLP